MKNNSWMKKALYSFSLSFLFCIHLCYAQEQREIVVSFEDAYKRTYKASRIEENERPAIDGKLDDTIWIDRGEWSAKFSQVIPFERVKTRSTTRLKLFYDSQNIYVGVYCKDEHPEQMNAFIGNRDDNSNGDLISIAFDSYHDYRAAVEFNLNLGGNKTDLVVTDKLSVNLSWNAVWEGRTHINKEDSCWTAELRIPFSQLRYNMNTDAETWGLHVRRIIRRNNEVQNWSLIPIKNNGHVFSFGEMQGMKDLPKPKGIEFLPYMMGKYRSEPKIEGSPFQKGHAWKGGIGLDAKLALNDYTMDLTVNPDYGQIEVDPSVMNLSAYETFYDEKRPFFLEGKHILEFANDADMMFYSRRVGSMPSHRPKDIDNINSYSETPSNVPIIGALKLTGTNKKGLTIGLLESITAQTSAKVMRNGEQDKEITEPMTNYTIARVQKNWEGNTLLGGMLTSVNRNLNQDYLKGEMVNNAYTMGIDFTHYFANRLYYVDTKGMFSSLHGHENAILKTKTNAAHYFHRASGASYLNLDPEKKSLNGTGGYIKIGRKGNAQWNYSQTFNWASPGFDLNSAGYMKQADYLFNESEIAFRKTDPWGPFRFAGINLTQKNTWDYGGNAVSNNVAIRWRSLSTKYRFEADIKETFSWNVVDSRILRGGPDMRYSPNYTTNVLLSTDRAKKIVVKFQYDGRYYPDKKTGYNQIRPSLLFRLGNHIHLTGELDYAWNKDNLQYVATVQTRETDAPNYIMAQMNQKTYGLTLRAQINITPDLSIQYYGSPFTSVASYTKFKLAADTKSRNYDNRFTPIHEKRINYRDGNYHLENETGEIVFKNPDFSFNEFRSNLVVRWEYLPGSTLYFVWENSRTNNDDAYRAGWGNNLDRMFGLSANNTLVMKINYWFAL